MRETFAKMKKVMVFCLMMCLGFVGIPMRASAINLESSPYIMVESYELSNEKIVPGEDFTLTLTLKNYSKNATAEDVLVNVVNPAGIAPVYGTVSQTWVDEIKPGETADVSFDYTSSIEIIGDYLDFNITMVGGSTNYITLRAPVGSDSPFAILAVSIPEQINVREVSSASVSFRVLGEENVRNVSLEIALNGESLSKSTIGILTAGTTRTQSISMTGHIPGDYEAELILYYDDEADQNQSVVVGNANIKIVQPVTEQPDNRSEEDVSINEVQKPDQNNRIVLLGVGGVLILGIFTVVAILARRKR